MKVPFTPDQFFGIFEKYNHTVFPAQAALFLAGLMMILMARSKRRLKDRILSGILGFVWLWTGVVYHILFFSEINKAAFGFGGLFIFQGLFFLWEGVFRERLKLDTGKSLKSCLGYFFMVYGLVIYPVVGFIIEREIGRTISLGLPCPTVILTFGFFLLMDKKLPKYLLIIPSLWALIGISAVINLRVYQDAMMLIAATVSAILLVSKRHE